MSTDKEVTWEQLSDWYDEEQGNDGDLWHRTLIDPTVIRFLGNVRNKEILDLGCGNGYISRRLSRLGAILTSVDSSRRIIDLARKRDPSNNFEINYVQSDAGNHLSLAGSNFDAVLANMSLMNIQNAQGANNEAYRVLRKDGKFVASISHPCFDNGRFSLWQIEKTAYGVTVSRKIRNYRKSFDTMVEWRVSPDKLVQTRAFHRSLSCYAGTLHSAGFVIANLAEPAPNEEFLEKSPEGQWIEDVPLQLVFEAVKL